MPRHPSLTVIGDTCGYQFPLSSSLLPLFHSIAAIWFMNEGCFDTSRYILANWFNNLLLKSKIHQGRICLLLEELSLRICLFIVSTSALGVMRTDPYFLFVKVVWESFQPQRPASKHPVISERLNKCLNLQGDLHNTIQIARPLPLVKYRMNWVQTVRRRKHEKGISVWRFPLLSQIWRMHVSQPHSLFTVRNRPVIFFSKATLDSYTWPPQEGSTRFPS